MSLNLIMVEPRVLMFLASIRRHNKHIFCLVLKLCRQGIDSFVFLPIDITS